MTRALRLELDELFPAHSEQLMALCLRGTDFPLGAAHPQLVAQLAGIGLDPVTSDRVRTAYCLLVAYYFLIDSAVDEQLEASGDLVYLGLLLSGSMTTFTQCGNQERVNVANRIENLFVKHLAEHSSSLLLESRLRDAHGSATMELDNRCIVGRSNAAILLYEILCTLTQREPSSTVGNIVEEFIVVVQESDDLSDWREDFRAGRSTPFLRRSISALSDASPSETELERHLYLTGRFEKAIATLVQRVDKLAIEVRRVSPDAAIMQSVLQKYRGQLVAGLRGVVEVKLEIRR